MKIRYQRLLELATHLESGKLGHKKFDFSTYNAEYIDINSCGTIGCAIGECPIVWPDVWRFNGASAPRLLSHYGAISSAEEWFGINSDEYAHLFYPNQQSPSIFGGLVLSKDVTKEQVASNIREFVRIKNQDNEI